MLFEKHQELKVSLTPYDKFTYSEARTELTEMKEIFKEQEKGKGLLAGEVWEKGKFSAEFTLK